MKLNLLRGRHPALRRALAASAAVLAGGGMVIVAATQASAAAGCRVNYQMNAWNVGFTANITLTNLGDPINGWTLRWTFDGNQQITQSWNSRFSQNGQQVTLTNEAWNGNLGTNAVTNPGFNASYSGQNGIPTDFTLNGTPCTGSVTSPTTGPTTGGPSTGGPTTGGPTTGGPTTGGPSSSPPPVGTHLDNPYVGARPYVNPDWAANAAAEPGGSRVANEPTFVWLDRIAAITGTSTSRGLREHLDTALQQGANMFQFVVYDLPGRDCAALASNGELGPDEIDRYEHEYIDPIAEILADPAYSSLRIVAIIEIDSLPNLVTNADGQAGATDACAEMKRNGNYVTGVQYALSKLHAIPNVYNYVDAAHHAWLGWDSNFGPAADLFASTAAGATGGCNTVDGFITNTANYSALSEPYFNINTTFNGQSVRNSSWVDFNNYVDELTYAQAFRNALMSRCFGQNTNPIGMLIDTSRNGWGGPNRPAGAPTNASNIDEFVDGARIDRRIHAGNWCNQSGAGLGERPRSTPAAGIDAYVWVKPPGESDGASQEIDNDEGKGFDRMCDPTYTGNDRNGNNPSGALPNAPLSGHWFSAQFQELMANAFPPL